MVSSKLIFLSYLKQQKKILALFLVILQVFLIIFKSLYRANVDMFSSASELVIFLNFFAIILLNLITLDFFTYNSKILDNDAYDIKAVKSVKLIITATWIIFISIIFIGLTLFSILLNGAVNDSLEILKSLVFDIFAMGLFTIYMSYVSRLLNINLLYFLTILYSSFLCASTGGFSFNFQFELFKIITLIGGLIVVKIICNANRNSNNDRTIISSSYVSKGA